MKKEELDLLKTEVEAVNQKLEQLSEDELKYVSGGHTLMKDSTNFWADANQHGDPQWADWEPVKPGPKDDPIDYLGKK